MSAVKAYHRINEIFFHAAKIFKRLRAEKLRRERFQWASFILLKTLKKKLLRMLGPYTFDQIRIKQIQRALCWTGNLHKSEMEEQAARYEVLPFVREVAWRIGLHKMILDFCKNAIFI